MSVFSKLYIKACSEINLAISALLSGSDKKLVQSVGVGTFRLVISLRTGAKPLDLFFRVPSLTN